MQRFASFAGVSRDWQAQGDGPWKTHDRWLNGRPSALDNESFVRWVGRLQRVSCSPKDFIKQLESVVALDAGDAPERITTRTLVMHVKGDRVLPAAGGRLLAELIPNAQYVEIPGEDHFAWIMPNWRDLDDILIAFATGVPVTRTANRRFATVLFTDIVGPTRQW